MWDLETNAEIAQLQRHSGLLSTLCVLPGGRLASNSHDGTIKVWDLKTKAEAARLEGHSEQVSALCALPDGRLASCSRDKTIRLWDVASKCEIACLEVDAGVKCITALPNARLVAGDDLGVLHWLEIVD